MDKNIGDSGYLNTSPLNYFHPELSLGSYHLTSLYFSKSLFRAFLMTYMIIKLRIIFIIDELNIENQ